MTLNYESKLLCKQHFTEEYTAPDENGTPEEAWELARALQLS